MYKRQIQDYGNRIKMFNIRQCKCPVLKFCIAKSIVEVFSIIFHSKTLSNVFSITIEAKLVSKLFLSNVIIILKKYTKCL